MAASQSSNQTRAHDIGWRTFNVNQSHRYQTAKTLEMRLFLDNYTQGTLEIMESNPSIHTMNISIHQDTYCAKLKNTPMQLNLEHYWSGIIHFLKRRNTAIWPVAGVNICSKTQFLHTIFFLLTFVAFEFVGLG